MWSGQELDRDELRPPPGRLSISPPCSMAAHPDLGLLWLPGICVGPGRSQRFLGALEWRAGLVLLPGRRNRCWASAPRREGGASLTLQEGPANTRTSPVTRRRLCRGGCWPITPSAGTGFATCPRGDRSPP